MSSQTASLERPRVPPEVLRVRCFALVLLASAAWGVLVALLGHPGDLALAVLMPACVLWILSDLRARRVSGVARAFQLLVSLFPFWGLLVYLVWTRRLVGVLQWFLFLLAISIPAGLAGGITHGIVLVARGERW